MLFRGLHRRKGVCFFTPCGLRRFFRVSNNILARFRTWNMSDEEFCNEIERASLPLTVKMLMETLYFDELYCQAYLTVIVFSQIR